MKILQGFVCTGRAHAAPWMKADPLFFPTILGVDYLSPGTINIKVSDDHFLFSQAIRPDDVRKAGYLRALACVVGGLNGFILSTWPEDPPRPETVFEIVAGSNLRSALGLKDFSSVELNFDPSQVRKYPVP